MIELYSGTPGSGKSLHVASDIRNRLLNKKCVIIGNFFVDVKLLKKRKGNYILVQNDRLTPGRLLQFSRRYSHYLGRRLREGELLLVIDEAQLLFNSREWQNVARQGWLSFFSQHRHYGYDVILIAQFDRMLDRQVRSLIEYDTIHRKVNRFGNIGFFVGLLFAGNLYVAVRYWYPIREKVSSDFFVGHKRVFLFYDSFNHFDSVSSGRSGGLGGPTKSGTAEKKNIETKKIGIEKLDFSWKPEQNVETAADSGDDLVFISLET